MSTDDTERIGAAISTAAATVSAPAGLRERVAAQERPPRRWRVVAPPVAVAAALVVALAIALDGPELSVGDAAAAALRDAPGKPAAGAAPARIGDLAFPRWDGLSAAGVRRERLDGRDAVTVAYDAPKGGRVGYTIVDSPPLAVPDGARRAGSYAVMTHDGATVVTWRRDGHTCVLASRDLGAQRLLALAGGAEDSTY